jgi:hypothetical protein
MATHFRNSKRVVLIATVCIVFGDCVQKYVSPYKSPPTGYLVVDGYISANSQTQYTLTRTIGLPGDSTIPVVTGAQVQVEGSDSSIYPLTEEGNGQYGISSLSLSASAQYRLRISIPNGETYLSDYVPYKPTPPIDSVNWIQSADGVNIYVNTHDPTNSTRYYEWAFDQTYEYHSAVASEYIFVPSDTSIVLRTPAQMIFTCWKDIPPGNLVVGNSAKLAQDVIYEFPLVNIPANNQALSIEYSILVTQYALTESGYVFLSLMAQNTQSLGSIFDAQPSQVTGNIHSLSNPNETVIGYIQAGTVQQQRIFINNLQLQNWVYDNLCPDKDFIVPPDKDSLQAYFAYKDFVPLYYNFGPSLPAGWVSNDRGCVDCRDQGGMTQKPSYWPN